MEQFKVLEDNSFAENNNRQTISSALLLIKLFARQLLMTALLPNIGLLGVGVSVDVCVLECVNHAHSPSHSHSQQMP